MRGLLRSATGFAIIGVMSTLIIPVGIPGSGKSTWTREVFPAARQVSSDAIRLELFGSLEAAHKEEAKERNNEIVFKTFHTRIALHLLLHRDVVADATNLNADARLRLQNIVAEQPSAKTHLVLFKNVVEGITRNAARGPEDRVPERAMEYMVEKYWDALSRLPYESYDRVTMIESFQ